MKFSTKYLLMLLCLFQNLKSDDDNVFGKTHFSLRPQDSNVARKMMGVEDKIHLFGKDDFYGVLSTASEFQTTFNSKKLGRYFSFVKNSNVMTYSPMTTRDQCGQFDINSVIFGTGATGAICFNPRIRNFIYDVDLWVSLDKIVCGLWSRLYFTLCHTNWNLKLHDTGVDGTKPFYIPITTFQLPYENISAYFKGGPDVPNLITVLGTTSTIITPGIKNGKINGSREETGFSGIHFDLGYDLFKNDKGHLGASLQVVFPTGNHVKDTYLFNPVLGTNNWQLGLTMNAAYTLWQNCDDTKKLNLYFDAVLTHLFKHHQKRLFGLKNLGVDGTSAGSSYTALLIINNSTDEEIAADILGCEKKIGNDAMLDAALMLQYDIDCFSFGVGYDLWYRTKEKMGKDKCKNSCAIPENIYQYIGNISTCLLEEPDQFSTLMTKDIDYSVGLNPSSFSNKIFGFVEYNWKNKTLQPYILLGGEIEWGKGSKAANQAGIIFKGGISF